MGARGNGGAIAVAGVWAAIGLSACFFEALGDPNLGATTGVAATESESSGTSGTSRGGTGTTGEPTGGTTGVLPTGSSSGPGETTAVDATTTVGQTTGGAPETSGSTGATGMSTGACEPVLVYVDADGDGYGDINKPTAVCEGEWDGVASNGDDCNDAAAEANPGEPEICDGLDNDCDDMLDEYDPLTNKDMCQGCVFRVREQRLYYFCSNEADWEPARAFCVANELDLVIDSDTPEHDWLVTEIDALSGYGENWWIGGRQMGDFKWIDGTAVPMDARWFQGEPNDQGYPFDYGADCMVLAAPGPAWGGKWMDWVCDEPQRFICEGPEP